jgi:hypothetical protein
MAEHRIVIAVASCESKSAARRAREAVRRRHGPRHRGDVTALLHKGAAGQLAIDELGTAEEPSAWRDALLAALLLVVAAPLGLRYATTRTAKNEEWNTIGLLVDRFWHDIARGDLRQMSDLLEAGQSAVVAIAIDHDCEGLDELGSRARSTVITDPVWVDVDAGSSSVT